VCAFRNRGGPASPAEWRDRISEHHLMLLMSAALSILGVTRATNATFKIPSLTDRAERQMANLKAGPFLRNENEKGVVTGRNSFIQCFLNFACQISKEVLKALWE